MSTAKATNVLLSVCAGLLGLGCVLLCVLISQAAAIAGNAGSLAELVEESRPKPFALVVDTPTYEAKIQALHRDGRVVTRVHPGEWLDSGAPNGKGFYTNTYLMGY